MASAKLNEKQWAEIVEIWERGMSSAAELAEQYRITVQTLNAGLKRRGAIYGIRAAEEAKKAADIAVKDDFQLLIERARETKNFHYTSSKTLASLAYKKIADAERGNISYVDADEQIKTILSAMKVQGIARQERFAILGLDKGDLIDDTLPELIIHEMSDSEIQEIRRAQADRLPSIADELDQELESIFDEDLG